MTVFNNYLLARIESNTSEGIINLREENIGDEEVEALAKVIQNNYTVWSLQLPRKNGNITDKGLKYFAEKIALRKELLVVEANNGPWNEAFRYIEESKRLGQEVDKLDDFLPINVQNDKSASDLTDSSKSTTSLALEEDKLVKAAPMEDNVVEEVPMEDKLVKAAPMEDNVVEEVLMEDKLVKAAPMEDKLVKAAPMEDNVVEEVPMEDNVVQVVPMEDNVVQVVPVVKELVKAAPVVELVDKAEEAKEELVELESTKSVVLSDGSVDDSVDGSVDVVPENFNTSYQENLATILPNDIKSVKIKPTSFFAKIYNAFTTMKDTLTSLFNHNTTKDYDSSKFYVTKDDMFQEDTDALGCVNDIDND
ncbi:hypothetical protein [Candidatus Tisiphia endosymbiont of Nemotelus uliginosus]|uniref:hypothetical protein n=1 Tax=Candidatus Tisiphia endosymbiont of Nemotelus uliginosus TaxID=3077926 RepID=UPI0035C91D58